MKWWGVIPDEDVADEDVAKMGKVCVFCRLPLTHYHYWNYFRFFFILLEQKYCHYPNLQQEATI
ncbi:hypothetical protein [Neobacillus muris]|uniref:hypothetical protein n=1 Tax=Neobacillus muris TaxID=2941334 RepID=UPI00203BE84F|nr:hypothetical protein [Neobacillus muris]